MTIAYLEASSSSDIPVDDMNWDELNKIIAEHKNTVFYSIDDFVNAFNQNEISDLGLIALIE